MKVAAALSIAALLCVGTAAIAAQRGNAGAAMTAAPHTGQRGAITHSASVSFASCTSHTVVLSVTVPTHSFTPSQPVRYTVRLRNTGAAACGTTTPTPTTPTSQSPHNQTLTVGPCSPIAVTVYNARRVDVYPGHALFGCPMETGFVLAAHSTAQATASWDQTIFVGSRPTSAHARPGRYRLVVDGAVGVPVILAPG
jgi:hypothetical protein